MSFHAEDQKWTAYLLDELDAAERASVERELAESAEARQFVEELRGTMQLLTVELKSEPVHALTAAQRALIHEQSQPKVSLPEQRSFMRRRWADISIVTATVLLLAAFILPMMQRARETARSASTMDKTKQIVGESHNHHDVSKNSPVAEGDSGIYSSDMSDRLKARELVERLTRDAKVYQSEKPADESGLASHSLKNDLAAPGMGGGSGGDQKSNQFHEMQPAGLPVSGTPARNPASHDESLPASEPSEGEYADEARDIGSVTRRRRFADPYLAKHNESNRHFSSVNPEGKPAAGKESGQAGDRSGTGKNVDVKALPLFSQSGEVTRFDIAARGFMPPKVDERRLQETNAGWAFKRGEERGAEAYDQITDNPFHPAKQNPLSTFSIDVDTASYSNIRRFLTQNGVLPPPAAVRIEEMINYFRYDYPQPEGDVPFSVTTEVAGCPWNAGHRLVRVGLKGREIDARKRPASNLVFLLDVSGSMSDANKLPLVREAMKLLVEQLTENDRVAIVVYAGSTGCVLGSTTGDKQREIREAIDRLEAGGSTNGAGGIQHAYEIASQNFIKGGTNRVILATDGDFNVGITDREQLIKLITEQAKSGVFLTTLGFGMGNLKDGTLEQLADKGNGNYAYIDDLREAKKVFVEQMNGTLVTIAKDVKIQIEFNPAEVASYRLIGYENRILAHEDFNDDKKDAGEIGAGHTVTALYEIAPAAGAASEEARPAVDQLKYQPQPEAAPVKNDAKPGELLTLKLRYKQPDGDTSKLIESVLTDSGQPYGKATADFKFASAVALFGMILRDSPHKGTGTIDGAIELGLEGLSKDDGGYRTEFVELVKAAKAIAGK